jgi:hypothetical protein
MGIQSKNKLLEYVSKIGENHISERLLHCGPRGARNDEKPMKAHVGFEIPMASTTMDFTTIQLGGNPEVEGIQPLFSRLEMSQARHRTSL